MNKQIIETVVEETYNTVGLPRCKSRRTAHAQMRAAMGSALGSYFQQQEIADALNIDRSTVCHYKRNHNNNLNYWEGYKSKYSIAKEISDIKINARDKEADMETTLKQIKELEKRLKYLREEKKDLEGTNLKVT